MAHTKDEVLNFFGKQIALDFVQHDGQKKWMDSSVVVVGAGGLGCSAILHLVASGVGNLGICDNDYVSIGNLSRQVLFMQKDIGKLKVVAATERIKDINPFTNIFTESQRLCENNIHHILSGYDLILDCTDNIQTKMILHDYAFKHRINYIQAGMYQCYAEMFVLPFHKSIRGGCLRCIRDRCPTKYDSGISQYGVISMFPGIVGTWQAYEAIKLLMNEVSAENQSILFDFEQNEIKKLTWNRNLKCNLCMKGNGDGF